MRERVEATVRAYFDALDRFDVEATLACFAPGAELRCMSDERVARGEEELRAFFHGVVDGSEEMLHAVTNVVVEPDGRRAATEQDYDDRRSNGNHYAEKTCNFFDFDAEARITAVRFWRGG